MITCAVPAFMLLNGVWNDTLTTSAIVLAVLCVLSLALYPRLRQPRATAARAPAPELREGEPVDRVGGASAQSTRVYGNVAVGEEQSAPPATDTPPDRRR